MKNDQDETNESIIEGVVDNILPGMGKLINILRKNSSEFSHKIEEKESEIKKRLDEGYSPEPRIHYGIKVNTLSKNIPDSKFKPQKPEKPEISVIEPLVDIFDEIEFIRVVVEMPGIEEEQIDISLQDTSLYINTTGKRKRYQKEISLPCLVEIKNQRYQNGILELILQKKND